VQDLARSLVVASTICHADGFVRPQFTPAQARQLARALECMAQAERSIDMARAAAEERKKAADAVLDDAATMLRKAQQARVHALVLFTTSVAICALSLLAVWLI
jgi:hypothetical protein